jgi:hypothetical protein
LENKKPSGGTQVCFKMNYQLDARYKRLKIAAIGRTFPFLLNANENINDRDQ